MENCDVTNKILSLLPTKSLEKFRCVCKSWNSTITQDAFFAAHHLNNRRNCAGTLSLSCTRQFCKGKAYYSPPFLRHAAAADNYSRPPVEFPLHRLAPALDDSSSRYSITNSCDGLVGIFGPRGFYVVNPSIGKLIALPGETLHSPWFDDDRPQAGIGFDVSTGKYKAVRLFESCEPFQSQSQCEVFTMGGKSVSHWKSVCHAPFRLMYSRMVSAPDPSPPVLVNGALHWTVPRTTDRGQGRYIALSFDLSSERFHVVLHPKRHLRPLLSEVVSLGGGLCIADTYMWDMRMDIWVAKDRSNRQWVKQYDIDLSGMHLCKVIEGDTVLPVTVRNDGIVLLYNGLGRRDYYDLQTGCILKGDNVGNVNFEQIVTYVDTMVWPWPNGMVKL